MMSPSPLDIPTHRVRWAIVAIAAVCLLGSGITLLLHRHSSPAVVIMPPEQPAPASEPTAHTPPPPVVASNPKTPEKPTLQTASIPSPPTASQIYVHVAGAVKKPWLYALSPDSRVMEAIQAAGGPRADADLDAINLAERVTDGEKVYVPAKAIPEPASEPHIASSNTISHSRRTMTAPAADPGTNTITVIRGGSVDTDSSKPSVGKSPSEGKSSKLSASDQGQININTADADQLQRLPGIGSAMAARIIAYRDQAHGFRKAEDLMNVGGIGPKKFARIASFITVD